MYIVETRKDTYDPQIYLFVGELYHFSSPARSSVSHRFIIYGSLSLYFCFALSQGRLCGNSVQ